MAEVSNVWHPTSVDFVALDYLESLGLLAGLYTLAPAATQDAPITRPNGTVIAKVARFEWEIPYVERETRIYARLEGTGLAPRFLGHVREHDRIVGFLLERAEGRHAGIEDLPVVALRWIGYTVSASSMAVPTGITLSWAARERSRWSTLSKPGRMQARKSWKPRWPG